MSLKFVYTDADGNLCVVHAAPKEHLEKVLGKLTDKAYRKHVLARSIPDDAINVREISVDDIPADRKYRNAWVDRSEASSIDICMVKVKDLLLKDLRERRNALLAKSDPLVTREIETGKVDVDLRSKRQALRDCTEPLKAVAVDDSHLNCPEKLAELESAAAIDLENIAK